MVDKSVDKMTGKRIEATVFNHENVAWVQSYQEFMIVVHIFRDYSVAVRRNIAMRFIGQEEKWITSKK